MCDFVVEGDCTVDNLHCLLLYGVRETSNLQMLREEAAVNRPHCIFSGETQCKHTEVPLQSGGDGEGTGRGVHTGHVLNVVDFLQ